MVNHHPSVIIDGNGSLSSAVGLADTISLELNNKNRIEVVEPEKGKKSISIDQARELRKKVTLKSQSDTKRVIIIKDISLMGDEAQNTLLKTLEELGDNIVFLMPVANSDDILPTIRSRSQLIRTKNDLTKSDNRKQQLIDGAMLGYKNSLEISEMDVTNASEFMRYSVSDRLHHYKDIADNREKIMNLLQSLRVLCISAMRETQKHDAKLAWSKKVQIINDLLDKANANASAKLLLLGASTRL